MGQGILLGACRSPRGFDDLASHDIEIDEPGQGPMPDVLEFASQHMTGLHRQIGIFALGGLHTSQLIHADGALSAPAVLSSLGIPLTPFPNLLVPLSSCTS